MIKASLYQRVKDKRNKSISFTPYLQLHFSNCQGQQSRYKTELHKDAVVFTTDGVHPNRVEVRDVHSPIAILEYTTEYAFT